MDRKPNGQDELAAQLLRAIVDSSDDAIISKDLNGVITSWNKSAERLFGFREAEAIGNPITILIPSDRLEEEPQIISRIRSGERVDHFETIRRRKDGTLLDISLTISPVRDLTGTIIGASKIARDITERKKADADIRRANRDLEQFAYSASPISSPSAHSGCMAAPTLRSITRGCSAGASRMSPARICKRLFAF